jgi:hypothetical protein
MVEIFSYWIFVWFILYYLNLVKYNPLIVLIIAYVITLFELIYLWQNNINKYNLIKFFIINVIIKFIPILLIFKYPLIIHQDDLLCGVFIFCIYIFTMSFLNKNPYIYYKKLLNTYIKDDDEYKSFISILYDKIINYSYNI